MARVAFKTFWISILLGAGTLLAQEPAVILVQPQFSTDTVRTQADDAAIWVHPSDPSKSLLLGTDAGFFGDTSGVYIWNLDGSLQQHIQINFPQHIDVRYGMQLGGALVDIAVVAMRDHNAIRVYKIDPQTRTLINVTAAGEINLFSLDGTEPYYDPFGLGLYKRPADGAIFAFVTSRSSEFKAGVMQVRLEDDGSGLVRGVQLRRVGTSTDYINGVVVDDVLGYLYLVEEDAGVHKHYADPEASAERLAFFAQGDGIVGERAGLALYSCGDSTGHLLLSNPGSQSIKVYRREGDRGDPHRHELVATIQNVSGHFGAGLDVASRLQSDSFPVGLLMWQNQTEKKFDLFDWRQVAEKAATICFRDAPTAVEFGANEPAIPDNIVLQQNYPNPFNPETIIRFIMRKRHRVAISVYDLTGKKIQALLDAPLDPGAHQVRWNGTDDVGRLAASGIYFYQLVSGGFSQTRRMVLLR
jgi:3-phytase